MLPGIHENLPLLLAMATGTVLLGCAARVHKSMFGTFFGINLWVFTMLALELILRSMQEV